ncbi:MAG: HD domain-containing protein [Alphaproteobacteria bacterium]
MKTIVEKTYEFAKNYHSNEKTGHDFEHIKRVYTNAKNILKSETSADEFIVLMSALLHDVDDPKMQTDGKEALRFLQTLNLEKESIETILSTIEKISFTKSGTNTNFETLEMRILSDADKLDSMGCIGICRTIMFGAVKERPLFDENMFPIENMTREQYTKTKTEGHSINHFFDKLLKLKNAMQTDTGKNLAEKRHLFMIDFLRNFFNEQNLNEWNDYLNKYLDKN